MATSGSGTGTPITGSTGVGGIAASHLRQNCVSYHRSLQMLRLSDIGIGYGLSSNTCGSPWPIWKREGWMDALAAAEARIRRRLKKYLCPTEICDEVHYVRDCIRVNQAPLAYVGQRTYGSWVDQAVTVDLSGKTAKVTITDLQLSGLDVETIQFAYNDTVQNSYDGTQALQSPYLVERDVSSYTFTWHLYQMIPPSTDSVVEAQQVSGDFMSSVRWRTYSVDASLAAVAVKPCGCPACSGTVPTYTVEIMDAKEGAICLSPSNGCVNTGAVQVKISYGSTLSCEVEGLDPAIEQAIVYLAILMAYQGPGQIKACGCDEEYIDHLLETSPVAGTEFAHKLIFGPTRAGMEAQRIVDQFAAVPSMVNPVNNAGGLFASRSERGRRVRSRTAGVLSKYD